ncbi:MAG: hypothetical protein SPI68_07880 [Candidatus Faecousia sp.]|jgi:hypothetical protein|nr:hypothetical protein [Eubacteriales bacterium]MDY6067586.1 hypothetical protein [Candidatus Faecousia sp.]
MPLPLLFIGIAAATGLAGAGKTVKAVVDNTNANKINTAANEGVDNARKRLEQQRGAVAQSLEKLGEEKLQILAGTVTSFVSAFEKIKNIDFTSSVGLEELEKLHIDQKDFEELKELGNFAIQVAGGVTAGAAGGALTAIGAYGAAQTFAAASTGTAIASLSGAAATNATLAFFGGGSLAAGGLGMAGGMMVLGGLVAGPALLVMGLITGAKSQEKLDQALINKAQAEEIMEALHVASDQCSAIRRRAYLFYSLLAHLDTYLLPLVWQMEDIIAKEGTDYRTYSPESKKVIMAAASNAGSVKAVLDVPILTDDGSLTEQSGEIVDKIGKLLYK